MRRFKQCSQFVSKLFALAATAAAHAHAGQVGPPTELEWSRARLMLPGVFLFTGGDLQPYQTQFAMPELADPYVTVMRGSVVISGTAQYHLRLRHLRDIARGGPYRVVWNEFYDHDGSLMGASRNQAHSWDMKPVLWSRAKGGYPRLWDPRRDAGRPLKIWYGGHERAQAGNFSRDVFAFVQTGPRQWMSRKDSIFAARKDWPRVTGDFKGHRYGHQMVMTPSGRAAVYFEEVTETTPQGGPRVTAIFMDEMATPFRARGRAVELISPLDPKTGKTYPSALREDGAALVEGPLYFRFSFEGESWEAIGFSAGSFYARYPSCFAARRVADGLKGKPYQIDFKDDGSDFNDAGSELGTALGLTGGPGRPSVIVRPSGRALRDAKGRLQVLFHAYRRDIEGFRGLFHAALLVERHPSGKGLRFKIVPSEARSLRGSRRGRVNAAASITSPVAPPIAMEDQKNPSHTLQSRVPGFGDALARPERAPGAAATPDDS
jgi:hypothetical protein